MKKILLIFAAILMLTSCQSNKKENTNAIWLWSKYMTEVDLDDLAKKDIGNIILHEKSFEAHGEDSTLAFIKQAHKRGLDVHIWIQCFYKGGKWAYPLDDENNCYKQDFMDDIINRALKYVDYGVEGIHMDYIRFGGTAYKHNPSEEITATGCVTEFCRQMHDAVKARNPKVIISAAVMPEPESEYYYGQNPEQMGQYVDIFMPMIYKRTGGYKKNDPSWAVEVANYYVEHGAPAKVWAGTTTYYDDETEKVLPLDTETMIKDCMEFANNSKATGVVLFRYGLGEVPDLNGLWAAKE